MQQPSTSSALTELPRLVRALNRWLDGIAFVFKVAISACLAVMVVLNLYNVISRSVFGVAYGWIFSWTMLIFAWMLLLGLYVFIRHRRDVVVDIFMARLPAMLRRVAGLFTCVVGIAVMLAILRGAPALLQLQTAMMDTIDLPIYVRSLPLFIAAALILLHFTLDFICIACGWVEAFPRQDDAVEKGAIE
ncbi:TRAP-type C4-dicarboxylate transport system, small permease component [Monaibacterium marinum]|uniref:TRAP transporter small permease protein n=1 Tax=Pontivivens marinum TaxID=1690039 RepID=A0A2C9CRV2_9RHOB|nr:TRAP transporter small permease [Monaibacterium marinum]SOH93933.1 TRAP-type C4-dicarboxylate transport system, small permease component [Monaibacterium marinum]